MKKNNNIKKSFSLRERMKKRCAACAPSTQFKYGTGCMPSQMDGTEHVLDVDSKVALPDEFSWQAAMPPVRNQGMSTTCVCQSLTGVLDFMHNAKVDTPNVCNNYSIEELYSIRADKNAPGMTFKEALHYLRHHGLGGEKIESYSKVMSSQAGRYALLTFGPFVAGFPVYSGSNPHFWRKRGMFQGGHAITIVGYTKTGFIIRNSWGTGWGVQGHVEISYDEFESCCFEAWTTVL